MIMAEKKTTWDEYYKSRVRNNDYRDAFWLKYGLFIKEIIFNIKLLAHDGGAPIILKEEGCGIGTVSLAISNMEEKLLSSMGLTGTSEIKEVSKVIFSDIDNAMLGLCHENTCPIYSGGYLGNVPFFYCRENICEPKFFEAPSMVVTHGVLEHFADDDILKIISTYDNDNVLFQAHYVPTDRYKSPSFGDERLLSPEAWNALIKPDYYILDNNECDLYMFKFKKL
ncbi:hypothetical protein DXA84_07845 [Phocaeicola vulgatus]|mgnify:FL=1|jgi:hypothetical protein|nr:hypothetical protein DXA84_07845 [Phocaeicola vulgatus]RGO95231.1 hypothetical protein DXA82_07045 [Phocaeicola vulgatus]DAZ47537.1 MAG TPA: SAM-dependent methyltransferase.1, TehB-like SAM-dependent methyltransferase, Methyltransferase [Caudoviricetes sp.]